MFVTKASPSLALAILVVLVFSRTVLATNATNFDQCIKKIHKGDSGDTGGTNNQGQPINIRNATAITYHLCVSACGSAPEPFSWPVFSQQFSAWLLPYLALISQLPFGSEDKLDNLDSMILSVGSPALAAYSLALTVLNGRWITQRFLPFQQHPNAHAAVRVLSSLQQAPIRINANPQLLEALVTIKKNKKWWRELLAWLDITHTWTISKATSISWVIIAYLFTVIDSFAGGVTTSVNANGQGVGSVWLWLVPIVAGWFQISPKCDSKHLHKAIQKANKKAYVPTPAGNRIAKTAEEHSIYLSRLSLEYPISRTDELRSPPIFNYARLFPWVEAVDKIAEAFRLADQPPAEPGPPSGSTPTVFEPMRSETPLIEAASPEGRTLAVPHQNRRPRGDSRSSVVTVPTQSRWGHGTWQRILVAATFAQFLQWGTTGAALVVVWYTPTIGLGCRSGAYILYGVVSTLVWFAMLLSSILSHYSATAKSQNALSTKLADLFSIFFRRAGKIAAACNGIGLVVVCIFQFGNLFNRCYCNSSVFYWGKRAYDVIILLEDDVTAIRNAWIGGVFLAAGSALLFFVFVNLYTNPPFPPSEHHH